MALCSHRRSLEVSCALLTGALVASASASGAGAPSIGEDRGFDVAPYVARILDVAAMDPALAAALIPAPWIEFLVAGAFELEAEVAVRPSESDPPQQWPLGPWSDPSSLAGAIQALDSRVVAALYRELKPRLATHCARRGASLSACDRAMRVSGSKLSDHSVLERAADASMSPITPTQRELARLGVSVVTALRDQIQLLGIALWGPSWRAGG